MINTCVLHCVMLPNCVNALEQCSCSILYTPEPICDVTRFLSSFTKEPPNNRAWPPILQRAASQNVHARVRVMQGKLWLQSCTDPYSFLTHTGWPSARRDQSPGFPHCWASVSRDTQRRVADSAWCNLSTFIQRRSPLCLLMTMVARLHAVCRRREKLRLLSQKAEDIFLRRLDRRFLGFVCPQGKLLKQWAPLTRTTDVVTMHFYSGRSLIEHTWDKKKLHD